VASSWSIFIQLSRWCRSNKHKILVCIRDAQKMIPTISFSPNIYPINLHIIHTGDWTLVIYPYFLRNLYAVVQFCACVEWGHVHQTGTIPCSADASKFWRRWPDHHRTQISFCGQYLSGVRGGENLKVLSQSCRVGAVTLSIQDLWWVPESSTLVWGLALP